MVKDSHEHTPKPTEVSTVKVAKGGLTSENYELRMGSKADEHTNKMLPH